MPGSGRSGEELCAGTVDSWLIWRLTGGRAHVTDYSNASRTMLFNIHTLEWDAELCRILDIPMSLLPQPRPNSEVYGYAAENIPGLEALAGIPICGSAGDQPAALFGQACFAPGQAEKYLWNRLFYLDECGRAGGAVGCGTGDIGGLVGGRPDNLRTGGQCVQCRQHNPVAAG